MPTISSVPLLLLAALIWRATKGELLSVILFLSIFQAASVVNLGDMGIAPWLLVLVVGSGIKAGKRHVAPPIVDGSNAVAIQLILGFVCYAIFTGLLYPLLFQGVTVVSSHNSYPSPLSLSVANIAQICYLLAAVSVFLLAIFSSREAIGLALDWYVRGCVVASILAFYQLANALTGLPYPSAVFYSNPRYVIYPAYMIDGMWRLNSTFTEASSMAGHLSVGIALLGWNVMTKPLRWGPSLCLLLMTAALILTLSSTGYLSLMVIVVAGVVLSIRSLIRTRTLSRSHAIVALSVILALAVALPTTNLSATINKAVHSVLLDKEDSASYRERSASNVSAMETARQTSYVGAGWGSVRCSSLGAGLLATVGLPGTLLFCVFLASLAVPVFVSGYESSRRDIYEKALLATVVILAAMMVAGNEPDQPVLWVLFAACAVGPETLRKATNWPRQAYVVSTLGRLANKG